jgi:ribosomal protein S18 acetylase RimI-like enzyme
MGEHVAGVRVRACRREEIGEVLGLWAAARTPATSVPDDRAALEKLLDRDEDCLLVAERAGLIVGTLVAAWDGWRGNMYRLVVLPDHRRQGVARHLVRAGEERLCFHGARRMSALVSREEAPATALWAAVGHYSEGHTVRCVRSL